ncbi:DUF6252 family protein [Flavobacterium luminosum]|uniref:DUF6252 family protein n=1 Tax=Flavobacterium luminosum TaxID=2949086 RepID=A0ABT0TKZ9_9FLAO|nr:DUF6252 family protein [Flavobacterium sp. HXWNR70]MCL9808175.1 DUF6252 family protein [Flavobacterium sp. HXWNR70]
MKKISIILFLAISLFSCQNEVEFNDPAFQASLNNEIWKANIKSAKITNGALVLEGTSIHYNLALRTNSASAGKYLLGTTNQANMAIVAPVNASLGLQYTTGINPGAVYGIVIQNAGSGYITSGALSVSGGSGSGLKVNIEANSRGSVTKIVVNSPGSGYLPGDVLTITAGNNNAKILVQTVQNSNGEVVITKNTGTTISGTFKFTAFDANTGAVVSCKEGVFYNLPLQ